MDKRLHEINARLIDFSFGKFNRRITISEKHDELDGISNAINMLGEELNDVLISKNYFNSIFNSVSDIVFILEKNGKIVDMNQAATEKLFYTREELSGKNIKCFCKDIFDVRKKTTKEQIKYSNAQYVRSPVIISKNGNYVPVRISRTNFVDTAKKKFEVFTATDISGEILQENARMRTVIDAQERERQRIAKDLHDTLIQQLSAIKFHIVSNMPSVTNKSLLTDLEKSNEVLSAVIRETRDICFNLMPATLKEFGLIKAVREFLCLFRQQTLFQIIEENKLPRLSEPLEIDLYRIIQELISNSIKHGKATKVSLHFSCFKNSFKMQYQDNGKGFDRKNHHKGMGLQNIQSRIELQNGSFDLKSSLKRGTRVSIIIPIDQELWAI